MKSVLVDGIKSYIFAPEDPLRGYKSFLGLNLRQWGDDRGVLGLASFENRDWNSDEVHTLAMAGHWMISAAAAGAVMVSSMGLAGVHGEPKDVAAAGVAASRGRAVLASARLDARPYDHPYYWSAFVLYGSAQ